MAGNGLNGSKVAITSGINGLPEIKNCDGSKRNLQRSLSQQCSDGLQAQCHTIHCPAIPAKRHATFFTIFTREQRPHRPSGRYEPDGGRRCFKSGTLTLESGGDVWIDEGVIIENGATLIIECKGNVTISGGTVERGGSLRIDAGGEIMIQKGFEAKIGANVEFK